MQRGVGGLIALSARGGGGLIALSAGKHALRTSPRTLPLSSCGSRIRVENLDSSGKIEIRVEKLRFEWKIEIRVEN